MRILVVDDVALLRLAATALIRSICGIAPSIAENGLDAVSETQRADFDLVLMDLQMPAMDGAEAVAEIRSWERATPERRRTPVVAYTTEPGGWTPSRLAAAGFDGLLAKPATRESMAACLRRWDPSLASRRNLVARHVRDTLASIVRVDKPRVVPVPAQEVSLPDPSMRSGVAALNDASRRIEGFDAEVISRAEVSLSRSLAALQYRQRPNLGHGRADFQRGA